MNHRLFDFIEKSPTAFHAVENVINTLNESGFIRLYEGTNWNLEKGKNYYVCRNGSAVLAFKVPTDDFGGFMIAASHSDSPCFKIKENPVACDNGYTKLSVERYGGMINATWLDRPLSVAGKVVFESEGTIRSILVDFEKPMAIIPNVAIHLNRSANENITYNAATDLVPIIGSESDCDDFKSKVAALAGVNSEDILSCDLFVYNVDKGAQFGDYISAPRLDDLQCVFASLDAFISAENS